MAFIFRKHEPLSQHPRDLLQHYLEDIVYGANDGIVTTFTVVSGVEGAKLVPMIVIILGFVNLFADGVSMGASRYLSIRASAEAHGITRGYLEPMYHGIVTFLSFLLFGFIPLFSFMVPGFARHRFIISCLITGVVLFLVGSMRLFITKKNWLRGGMEVLLVGGAAAIVAYFVGFLLVKWF